MKKLLNTLYITNENYYLFKSRENVVIKEEDNVIGRFPIHILEHIVTFSYLGVSPGVIKLCSENDISITYLTPQGWYCGKFIGPTNGNVLLRREQYRIADDDEKSLTIARAMIEAKLINSRKIYMRLLEDHGERVERSKVKDVINYINDQTESVRSCESKESLRGLEGDVARAYFQTFDELILQQKDDFKFVMRSKRPPLNRVNAVLSFLYSVLTNEIKNALETVGLDPYVGVFHTDRPGRAGLSLDLIEEMRSYLVDRFVVTLINRRQIKPEDFEIKENLSVLLNEKGRKKILAKWQERKHQEIMHPYLKEKIKIGLIPYVQAQLLSRYIRGDISFYPPLLI